LGRHEANKQTGEERVSIQYREEIGMSQIKSRYIRTIVENAFPDAEVFEF